jgi:hypothetical protein
LLSASYSFIHTNWFDQIGTIKVIYLEKNKKIKISPEVILFCYISYSGSDDRLKTVLKSQHPFKKNIVISISKKDCGFISLVT